MFMATGGQWNSTALWSPMTATGPHQPPGSVARHNSTQISFYKCALLNVLFSSVAFKLGFVQMQHTKMSLI